MTYQDFKKWDRTITFLASFLLGLSITWIVTKVWSWL